MRLSQPLAQPKPAAGTAKRARTVRRSAQQALDRRESAKVRVRSGGWCEVVEWVPTELGGTLFVRCHRRASHIHHMLKGIGVRGRGESVKAIRKQHVCAEHHQDIEGGVGGKRLIRQGGPVPLWTDVYRRVR